MLILLAAAVGVAAAVGLSLVFKLRAIRTRGFGEGSRLELPESGLAFRYPHWWKVAGERVSTGLRETVTLRTGHSRGLLRIAAWREAEDGFAPDVGRESRPRASGGLPDGREDGPGRPPADSPASPPHSAESLQETLAAVLRDEGLDLDDPEIKKASPPAGSAPMGPPVTRVWVASGGRQAARPEERSYFEAHLASIAGARVLFFYTNSVLQGFLDAYYLEKVLETLQPARFPR